MKIEIEKGKLLGGKAMAFHDLYCFTLTPPWEGGGIGSFLKIWDKPGRKGADRLMVEMKKTFVSGIHRATLDKILSKVRRAQLTPLSGHKRRRRSPEERWKRLQRCLHLDPFICLCVSSSLSSNFFQWSRNMSEGRQAFLAMYDSNHRAEERNLQPLPQQTRSNWEILTPHVKYFLAVTNSIW